MTERPDLDNPYAAPDARPDGPTVESASDADEALRRAYIGRERTMKAIGLLIYLGAAFWALYGLVMIVGSLYFVLTNGGAGVAPNGLGGFAALGVGIAALGVLVLAVGVGLFALGGGLRSFRPWARLTCVVLQWLFFAGVITGSALWVLSVGIDKIPSPSALAAFVFYLLIPALLIRLFLAPKTVMVFSPDYREVVARTPHVRYKMGRLEKAFFVVIIVVIGVVAMAVAWTAARP